LPNYFIHNDMKNLISVAIILLLLTTCKDRQLKDQDNDIKLNKTDIESEVDRLADEYIQLDIFSGVILIAKKGKAVYQKPFGLADREEGIPNKKNTLFDIGSMNKTFTSIVIKQLIAEGRLKYSDKLTDFIKGYEDSRVEDVTVRHLLDHESGFGDYHKKGFFDLPKESKTLQAIVDMTKSMQLEFEPGMQEMYSNTGYVLLGAIIEEVSGDTYFQNVRERIIKPLRLRNTYIEDLSGLEKKRAKGYYKTVSGELIRNDRFVDQPNPDGGFLSTVEDIMKFYRSYYYDTLLLSKTMKEDDPFFNYIDELAPGKAIVHAGGFEGFNTVIYQIISDDISIIVFSNMDEPVAEHLGMGILLIIRGQEPAKPSLPAVQMVYKYFKERGIDYIRENFEELTVNFHPADPRDLILNIVGYNILSEGLTDEAIELFKLNIEFFPGVANCWDSLGEAYMLKGDTTAARKAYEKALEINPDMETAKKALDKI